jgi:methionyl-tRNA formyltransferase
VSFAYAGTPEFGAQVLRHLVARGLAPAVVVTQPARPAGRGRKTTQSAVARLCVASNLPLVETADINAPDVVETLRESGARALVVAAFGQLLRPVVLDTFDCVNVHASLLPRHRGAAPIARALMNGDEETGVCAMRMTPGLDEGPVALCSTVSVSLWQDAGDVAATLALLGAGAVAHVLQAAGTDRVVWKEQAGTPTYAAKLTAADQVLDLTGTARAAHDTVRALSPDTGARFEVGSVQVKLWRTWPHEGPERAVSGRAGDATREGDRLFLGCGRGSLEVLEIQPAGKRRMDAADFLRGYGSTIQVTNTGP